MSVMIETQEFASDWMKAAVGESFHAAVLVRMYSADPAKYPSLRDRTDDAKRMLYGFGPLSCEIKIKTLKGHELRKLGWDIVGGQLAQDFKLVWKANRNVPA